MIIVNLFGGLGNQMFQYAFGEILSLNTCHEVKYNIDRIKFYSESRKFELDHAFDLDINKADRNDLVSVLGFLFSSTAARRLLSKKPFSYVKKYNHLIDGDTFDYKSINSYPDLYFDGYWQSAMIYSKYEEYIRSIFDFTDGLTNIDKDLISRIKATPSIAVHVRRGDYVSNRSANTLHGVLGIDYYINAINLIRDDIAEARVYFFSDDHNWVRKKLLPIIPNSECVSHNNGLNSYKDMQLMSKCENHVIANSTFSWWGAWLCRNSSKIIVAPMNWFSSKRKEEIFPDSWIRI